jgi:outer membrane protein assembly factor BamB
LADDCVYAATLDGTLYCFRQHDGVRQWEDAAQATSCPAVRAGKCYYSQREERASATGEVDNEQFEHWAARTATATASDSKPLRGTSRKADYLHHAKRMRGSPRYAGYTAKDAAVGFGFSKGSAKIHMAAENLGQAHVSGVWSYQGSKPFVSGDYLYASQGDTVQAVEVRHENIMWRQRLRKESAGSELLDAYVTPPCLVNDKVIVGTTDGDIYCLAAASGDTIWRARLPHGVAFQPAVEHGKVCVATEEGVLYCLNTGDDADTGWQMWGATAGHNGLDSQLQPV